MSITDAERWNRRYQSPLYDKLAQPRNILLDNEKFIPRSGRALDLACGLGQNSKYLSGLGLEVYSVDIAINAVKNLKICEPKVNVILADLENFFIPQNYFSLIINFYYFNPPIFQTLSKKLISGGFLFVETLTEKMLDIKPDIEKRHLLKPGELITFFDQFVILYYFEGWLFDDNGKQKAVAQMIAKKL